MTSQDAAIERLNNVSDDVDFIDAIMFSSRHGVVVEGNLPMQIQTTIHLFASLAQATRGFSPMCTRNSSAKIPWTTSSA
jgi:hypothetical protein